EAQCRRGHSGEARGRPDAVREHGLVSRGRAAQLSPARPHTLHDQDGRQGQGTSGGAKTLMPKIRSVYRCQTCGFAAPKPGTCPARAESQGPVRYVSGEESAAQVKLRANRLGIAPKALYFLAETDLQVIEAHAAELRPRALIVDSIQTVFLPGLESSPGSVSQVRECAARLMLLAKGRGMAAFLVGHVTK